MIEASSWFLCLMHVILDIGFLKLKAMPPLGDTVRTSAWILKPGLSNRSLRIVSKLETVFFRLDAYRHEFTVRASVKMLKPGLMNCRLQNLLK
jgi:hypothetical protein